MKTIKRITLWAMTFILLFATHSYSQNIRGIIKKKTEKAIDKTIDKIDGKEKKDKDTEEAVATQEHKPVSNFINGNIVFSDDFNNEKHGEFPSKWTQMSGTMQNSQIVAQGKKEGVVQFVTSGRMKPSFKNDDYLGNSFKIEGQFYFHGKGNEAYTLNLMNTKDVYRAYQITIRGDGIVPAGTSSQYARMPYKSPFPGWRTVQLSFNKGVLKVLYNGYQLINIPVLKKSEDKHITEFTHLEVSALSRSGNYGAMINHITIGHKGLPLYKKLVAEGRIVMHDILFDTDSYFIKPSSYPAIDRIVTMLQDNPKVSIKIEGHTDANGSKASNKTLSENRAKSVMYYLINKGIAKNRLSTVGFGEEKPIDMADNEEAWAKNRRVEIVKM
ncbi:OmpA family protein [Algibacter sp. 2305UL17-15]|uniref:OmpA family protein n=1 Tax=Algibacter sp. 2305UL17-15 TaxID=3231268 RepID=UPI0034578E0C